MQILQSAILVIFRDAPQLLHVGAGELWSSKLLRPRSNACSEADKGREPWRLRPTECYSSYESSNSSAPPPSVYVLPSLSSAFIVCFLVFPNDKVFLVGLYTPDVIQHGDRTWYSSLPHVVMVILRCRQNSPNLVERPQADFFTSAAQI